LQAEAEQDREWAALMAATQRGDGRAYARLLTAIVPVLRALARRNRVRPADVEDVVQDVLLALHRVRHTYDPDRPFLPWLAAIARRRAIDMLRREGRRGAAEADDPALLDLQSVPPEAEALAEAADMRGRVAGAVARLPPRQRRALELVKLRELSVREAARESGQSEGAVKVNVHRAIRAMRALLGES
jgi:RNA polymerase sigma-70 factor (ECF subfamily)